MSAPALTKALPINTASSGVIPLGASGGGASSTGLLFVALGVLALAALALALEIVETAAKRFENDEEMSQWASGNRDRVRAEQDHRRRELVAKLVGHLPKRTRIADVDLGTEYTRPVDLFGSDGAIRMFDEVQQVKKPDDLLFAQVFQFHDDVAIIFVFVETNYAKL